MIASVGPGHTAFRASYGYDAYRHDRSGCPPLRARGSRSAPGTSAWLKVDWLTVLDLTARIGVWLLAAAGLLIIFD